MKRISVLLFVVALCSCGVENRFVPSTRVPYPEATRFRAVDLVKSHKDPKGGWFGPSLLDVYLRDNTEAGENTPEEFCGNAPHIPTGEEITVFFTYEEGTSESSSCRLIVAVAKGEAVWNTKTGKPIGEKEVETIIQQESNVVDQWYDIVSSPLPPAWRNPRPIGPPCADTSGSPDAVRTRYRNQKCSIAVEYPDSPYKPTILFVNWIVTDPPTNETRDPHSPVMPEDVLTHIRNNHGANFVVTLHYQLQGLSQPQSQSQDILDQPVPPLGQNGKSLPDNSSDLRTNFTAKGPDGEYVFIWGHALHELTEPPAYSLGKLDPNADPDAELPTTHLETYLLHRPQSEQKGIFIFDFGEYEVLKPEQKAVVQGFCKERIRILHKAWPNVDEHDWRQGGWYELNAPRPKGNLSPVCN